LKFKYKVLFTIAPFVFILDQFTKWLIKLNIVYGGSVSVIPGYFDIVHVTNKGAAFGMFANLDASLRVPFFYAISAIAVLILVIAIKQLGAWDRMLAVVFSLILGGIAGNVLDRVRYGAVTDFLSVHIQDKIADFAIFGHQFYFRLEWPAFNVADSAITIAMVLLVIGIFKPVQRSKIKDPRSKTDPRSKI